MSGLLILALPSKGRLKEIERDLKTKIVKGGHRGIYDEKRVLLRDFIPRYLVYSQANKRQGRERVSCNMLI